MPHSILVFYSCQEAAALLASGGPDEDVFTRGQQKKLDNIKDEKPAAKKSKLARDNTMAATAKVCCLYMAASV